MIKAEEVDILDELEKQSILFDQIFNCVICLVKPFEALICSECNHIMCERCYVSFKKVEGGIECPVCRKTNIFSKISLLFNNISQHRNKMRQSWRSALYCKYKLNQDVIFQKSMNDMVIDRAMCMQEIIQNLTITVDNQSSQIKDLQQKLHQALILANRKSIQKASTKCQSQDYELLNCQTSKIQFDNEQNLQSLNKISKSQQQQQLRVKSNKIEHKKQASTNDIKQPNLIRITKKKAMQDNKSKQQHQKESHKKEPKYQSLQKSFRQIQMLPPLNKTMYNNSKGYQ